MSLGEFQLIERLLRRLPRVPRPARIRVGPGDDCAASASCGALLRLCSTDLLIEGTHFRRDLLDGRTLGAKALAVNLSDIAAMGGEPLDAFVSLALPTPLDVAYLEGLYDGLGEQAARHGVQVLGGDTTRSPGPLVISVTVLGQVAESELLLRSGARVGDLIYVSGTLGDSAAGLHALLTPDLDGDRLSSIDELKRRHVAPEPRVAVGRLAAASGHAHAAIDLSDGLSSDLRHVCAASRVGAEVDLAALPRSSALATYCQARRLDALELALHGGEDYELLLCGDAELGPLCGLHAIGRIVAGSEQVLVDDDGRRWPLPVGGWDHFARPA